MATSDRIRGLERGLDVLEALRSRSTSSLQELYDDTRLPKPSLLRILATLSHRGLVYRRLADGRYRLGEFANPGRRRDRYDAIAEAAAPVLDQLCRQVLWPSDLMVPAGTHMERRETSQAHSPFFPNRSTRNNVGQPVGWLLTGVGRAYLAFCPEPERARILERLRRSKKSVDLLAHQPKRLEAILADTRKRGYGTRDASFAGGKYGGPPLDDGLAAIAVPLIGHKRVYGSVNILWIRTAFTVELFATRHLAELQQASRDIVTAAERHQAGL